MRSPDAVVVPTISLPQQKLRILELLLAPMAGGAETLVAGLSLQFEQTGHDVTVAFLDSAPNLGQRSLASDIFGTSDFLIAQRTTEAPSGFRKRAERVAGVRAMIRRNQYDIVHTHTFLPNVYGRIGALLAHSGAKVVTTLHSASGVKEDFRSYRARYLERCLLYSTSAVVSVTDGDKNDFLTLFGASVPNIECIPNGLPREPIRRKQISANAETFIAVSRLAPVKDIGTLITGFDCYARSSSLATKLQIVGPWYSDSYRAEIAALLKGLGNPSHIEFLGPRSDIPELLAKADVYISASLQEAHPISLIEASAAGMPTVVSDIPEHRYSNDGRLLNGTVLFEIGSQAELTRSLAAVSSNWLTIASQAMDRADLITSKYSINTCAERYMVLFHSLLRAPNS